MDLYVPVHPTYISQSEYYTICSVYHHSILSNQDSSVAKKDTKVFRMSF